MARRLLFNKPLRRSTILTLIFTRSLQIEVEISRTIMDARSIISIQQMQHVSSYSPTSQTLLCGISQQLPRTSILKSMEQVLATLLTRPLLLSEYVLNKLKVQGSMVVLRKHGDKIADS